MCTARKSGMRRDGYAPLEQVGPSEAFRHNHPKKGTQVSNPSHILASLLHRLGVGRRARLDACQGSGAPKISCLGPTLAILAATIGALALMSAPALAAAPEPPEVSVETPVHATEAIFHGVVNPLAAAFPLEAGTYQFVYRPSTKAEDECKGAGEVLAPPSAGMYFGLEPESFSETVTGLTAGTEYAVCLVAEDNEGKTPSPAVPFTTAIPPETPEAIAPKPNEIAATTATLDGVLNPGAPGNAGTYEFFYRQSATECELEGAPEKSTPAKAAAGGKGEAAKAEVTGLLPGMQYTFCLLAYNTAEEASAPSAPVTFTTPAVAPTIESEFGDFATDVASTSATLGAEINPGGAETTYHFEYGTTSAYEQSTPESGLAGTGDSVQSAAAHIQGFQPSTTYHYRVVATNAQSPTGGTPGPDETFTTQPVGGELKLPDGRVWELVSPEQAEGAAMRDSNVIPLQAAADGDAITYNASKPIELEPQGNATGNRVFSWRGPSGWSSREIDIPDTKVIGPKAGAGEEYKYFSTDLAYGIVEPWWAFDPLLSPEATERTPYLRSDYANAEMTEACVSSCYRPLVTAANVQPPGTKFGGQETGGNILEEAYGPLHVVAVTPDLSSIVLNDGYVWTAGRLEALPGGFLAITDGRVFFAEEAGGIGVLNIATDQARSLASDAAFVMVSSDGSRVFFTREDHYFMVEVENGRITDLTPNEDVQIDSTGQVVYGININGAVAGHSEDGSYLYFEGVVDGREAGYVLHESSPEWTTSVVPGMTEATSQPGFLSSLPPVLVVSPDGRYLAFGATSSLTGYDNRDAVSGGLDTEVYVYDADTGRLACVSCNPTGERPSGASYLEGPHYNDLENELRGIITSRSRDVSDSGRVFFNSNDALVPQDVDGTQDVYEYEPDGVGSCAISDSTFNERSGGCVSLLSAGTSPDESTFLDAGETGGDVFLLTTSKLSSQDPGEAYVVYDAHECTSEVPCHVPSVGSPPCSTEASCRPAPTPQPSIYGAPSSATFSGAGNIAPATVAGVKAKTKPLTRAQKLARALEACKKKPKGKRAMCEKQARRVYGPVGNAKKSRRGSK